ncbi:MAG TPA: pirin family protein [Thermoanaerobaculia bacterium]
MITIRRSDERGRFDHGWLDTRHTFSFADYHDPRFMGFRSLRVINEDRVKGGMGFGTHGHRDMEIISYVLEGGLAHRDSLGTGSVIRPGDVQRMSAGTGVLHSEMNASPDEDVHFLQIWIIPERPGITPGYEQRTFADDDRRGVLRLVASRDAREGSVTLHQDVDLYAALLDKGSSATHTFGAGRAGWIQVARGSAELNGEQLRQGDGVSIENERHITLSGDGAEILLFDLA